MMGIVLSRRDIKESDQIISVYTKERGKLELYARGVKKIVSKNTAHLEPYSVVDIDIAQGKEIDYVTTVHPIEYFVLIRTHFEKSVVASYVVSLINTVTQEGEPDIHLYDTLYSWLIYIQSVEQVSFFLIDCFMVALVDCLGFSMSERTDFSVLERNFFRHIEKHRWEMYMSILDVDRQKTHQKIQEYLAYHTEKKFADWTKTCIF